MATAFYCRPSKFFGLNDEEDAWLAYSIDRATFQWGSFVQSKIEAKKEVPAPTSKHRPTITVPKYQREQIEALLNGPIPDRSAAQVPDDELLELWRDHPELVEEEADASPTKQYRSVSVPTNVTR